MDEDTERRWRRRIKHELDQHFTWSNEAIENLFIRMLKLQMESKEDLMIVANGTGRGGKPLILIGLSKMNMDKLLAGQPIRREEESLPADIIILGGETEDVILHELAAAGISIDNLEDRRGPAS